MGLGIGTEHDPRTSRISPFGLREESAQKMFAFSPQAIKKRERKNTTNLTGRGNSSALARLSIALVTSV